MKNDFDIIVVGSGMSGGYAAKEFSEKGYSTLVLDRGEPLKHGEYKTEFKPPWAMEYRGRLPAKQLEEEQFIQKKSYALTDFTDHHFISDRDHPYQQDKPFTWIRSAKVGGKSLLWARQSYRWNKLDFSANGEDGHGVAWPIQYDDVAPWYDYVEPFIGISGSEENLDILPDGKFLPPLPMNVAEKEIKAKLEHAFPERKLIPARVAHLTEPQAVHLALGRGKCMARNECQRGCSWGGYYSSLSGALAAAKKTGNMTLRANAQVQQVLYDQKSGKAKGVAYVDTKTGKRVEVSARIIFMCASTLASVQILLNSTSETFPNGIGNTSNALGHYVMDHVGAVGARGDVPGHLESYYKGRRPGGVYIPRFRNIESQRSDYLRGFGFQGSAERSNWKRGINQKGLGIELKERLRSPGGWKFILAGFGETLPDYNNRVYLHKTRKDKWGMPLLVTDVSYGKNAEIMKKDIQDSAAEMLIAAGLTNIERFDYNVAPGAFVHEMGGACMGQDPKTSYLNKWNQNHEVKNLFVTDGAAFSSISCVNPSITFMALTARAADFAAKQMEKGVL